MDLTWQFDSVTTGDYCSLITDMCDSRFIASMLAGHHVSGLRTRPRLMAYLRIYDSSLSSESPCILPVWDLIPPQIIEVVVSLENLMSSLLCLHVDSFRDCHFEFAISVIRVGFSFTLS